MLISFLSSSSLTYIRVKSDATEAVSQLLKKKQPINNNNYYYIKQN